MSNGHHIIDVYNNMNGCIIWVCPMCAWMFVIEIYSYLEFADLIDTPKTAKWTWYAHAMSNHHPDIKHIQINCLWYFPNISWILYWILRIGSSIMLNKYPKIKKWFNWNKEKMKHRNEFQATLHLINFAFYHLWTILSNLSKFACSW